MSRGALLALVAVGAALWWWTRRSRAMSLADKLRTIMPHARADDVEEFAPAIAAAMNDYGIDAPKRQAAFLAQIAVESDQLWWQRDKYGTARGEEYSSGQRYEGRGDLGNTEPGDGPRYKGRGLLQITGRANYARAGDELGLDLAAQPELLLEPRWSAAAAAAYWQSHGLNELADAGDYLGITRRINGGTSGLAPRQAALERAGAAFGEA